MRDFRTDSPSGLEEPGCREDLPTAALPSKASSRDAFLPFTLHSDWPGPEISVNVVFGSRSDRIRPSAFDSHEELCCREHEKCRVCFQPLGSRKSQRRHLESFHPPEPLEKLKREK